MVQEQLFPYASLKLKQEYCAARREAIYPLSRPSETSWGVHDLSPPTTFITPKSESDTILKIKGI